MHLLQDQQLCYQFDAAVKDDKDEDDPTVHSPICPKAGAELMEFPPEIRRVQPHMCTPLKIGHKLTHTQTPSTT